MNHLALLKSTGSATSSSTSDLSTLPFKAFELLDTYSNLSTSDFKLTKSTFLANFDVSTPAPFFKSNFIV